MFPIIVSTLQSPSPNQPLEPRPEMPNKMNNLRCSMTGFRERLRSFFRPGARRTYFRQPLAFEVLEDRLTPAFLDLGGILTFDAPAFTPNASGYQVTSGKVELGLKPIGSESLRYLVEINLDALPGGVLQINTAGAAPTFDVTNAAVTLVATTGINPTVWQTTDTFTFDARLLTENHGQTLTSGTPVTFDTLGASFTTTRLLLTNSSTTTTENSYVELQGKLGFAFLPALELRVDGNNYLYAKEDGLSLNGAGMTLAAPAFPLKGMTITDAGVTADYTKTTNGDHVFFVSGGFTMASSDGNLQTQASTLPGGAFGANLNLEITNGALTAVGGTLNTNFTVYKAEFTGTDLKFDVNLTNDEFTFSGDVTLTLSPDANDPSKNSYLDATFGHPNDPTPGLSVKDGVVQNVTADVTGNFNLFSVNFQVTDPLKFEYNASASQFEMTGGVSLNIGSTNKFTLTVDLPAAAGQYGLVVKDGQLQRLDAQITAGFQLGGLNVDRGSQDNLAVGWTRQTDTLTISGSASLENIFHVEVDLGGTQPGSPPGIQITDGEVQFDDLKFTVERIPLGAFSLQELQVAYEKNPTTGIWNLGVALDVVFPGGWEVGGKLAFVNGELNSIEIEYAATGDDEGIALGDSGLFLTYAEISVTNLENPTLPVTVGGDVAVTFGPQVAAALADPRNPTATPQQGSIFAAQGSFLANGEELSISGGVYFGALVSHRDRITNKPTYEGLLGEGTGYLNLDWAARVYSAGLDYELLDGAFAVKANFTFKGGHDDYLLFIDAEADLAIPKFVPVVGGLQVASADFILDIEHNFGTTTGFFAGWADLAGIVVGVKYDITTAKWSLFGKKEAAALIDCEANPELCLSGSGPFTYHNSFAVPAGATAALLSVSWPENIGTPKFAVVLPNSTVVQENDFNQYNISLVNVPNSPTSQQVSIVADPNHPFKTLETGNIELQLISTVQFNAHPVFTSGFTYPPPTASVTNASNDLGNGNLVHVTVVGQVDPAFQGDVTARLFIDTDSSGHDGTALPARNVTLTSNGNDQYQITADIDLTDLFFQDYYVYARVSDGVNSPVYSSYSPNPVSSSVPLSGTVINNAPGYQGQRVSGVRVYVDANANGVYDADIDPSGVTNTNGGYTVTNTMVLLNIGQTYNVGLVLPPGATFVSSTPPWPTHFVFDPNVGYDFTYTIDLSAGISGVVFEDLNKDGQYDSTTESVIPGIRVYVDVNNNGQFDPTEPHTISLTEGDYHIYGLAPNTPHTVRLDLPTAFPLVSSPLHYRTLPEGIVVTLPNSTYQSIGNNLGALPRQRIWGTVTGYPLDQSGVLSPTAGPLENWSVQLSQDGTVIATAQTDINGRYQFLVPDGTYTVTQVLQSGWRELQPFSPELNINTNRITNGMPWTPGRVAVADFNGDTTPDLVVGNNNGGNAGSFHILWGNGTGNFSANNSVTLNTGGAQVGFMNPIAADTSGTGRPDVVLWMDGNNRGDVYRIPNLGGGNFGEWQEIISVYNQLADAYGVNPTVDPIDVATGDIDGDGKDDVVQTWYASNGVGFGYSVWLSSNPKQYGTYFAQVTSLAYPQLNADNAGQPGHGLVRLVDLRNNGRLDLVLAGSNGGQNNISVGLNDGTGHFNFTGLNNQFPVATNLALADIDADGLPDLLFLEASEGNQTTLSYHHGNGNGTFSNLNPSANTPLQLPYGQNMNLNTYLVDLNGDLRPEVLVYGENNVNNGFNWIGVWTNNGTGPYYSTAPQLNFQYPVSFGNLSPSAVGDITGDGLADILVSGANNNAIYVYLNQSAIDTGTYTVKVPTGGPPTPRPTNFVNGQLGGINGAVYEDVNRNGKREAGDWPLSGVQVYLDLNRNGRHDAHEPIAVTGGDGAYAFAGLVDGRYLVRILYPASHLPDASGDTLTVSLSNGQAVADQDFLLLRRWLKPIDPVGTPAGGSLSFTVAQTGAASDPYLRFVLDPGGPAGAVIDPRTGVFSWVAPEEVGSYNFTARLQNPFAPVMHEAVTFTVVVHTRPSSPLPQPTNTVASAAPIVYLPPTPMVARNGVLLFSPTAGRAIVVGDGGSAFMLVNVRVIRGKVRLTSGRGRSGSRGSGVRSLTLWGQSSTLNRLLAGLVFHPTPGFVGNAQLMLEVSSLSEMGDSGSRVTRAILGIRVR